MMETKAMLKVQFIEVAIVHPREHIVNFLVSLHKNWQNVFNHVAVMLIHMVYFNS
jgi:predicted P-loop ATPase